MSRIVVTGGAGFIGSHLVHTLVGTKHHVMVVDDLSTGKKSNLPKSVKLAVLDIRSPKLRSLIRRFKPQIVFHLAAQKNVRTSIENPKFDADVNILGTLNLIEACVKANVRRFIFSSTGGAIYGDYQSIPTLETAIAKPEAPYGIAKLASERYLTFFSKIRKLSSVSLRYSNVFGPRQDPKGEAGVVAIFAKQLLQGGPLAINGHGRQTRDYIYVSDVVKANLAAMRQNVSGQINIGTGKETSVNSLAKLIMKVSGIRTRIVHRPAVDGEVQRSAIQPNLAHRKFSWWPSADLNQGLQLTWEWAKGGSA